MKRNKNIWVIIISILLIVGFIFNAVYAVSGQADNNTMNGSEETSDGWDYRSCIDLILLAALIDLILLAALVLVTCKYARDVKRQADLMSKNTNIMITKMNLDRCNEEMHKLVGPLYTDKHHPVRFANILFTASETGEHVLEHHNFWNKIRPYIYLGSDELRSALEKYIELKVREIEKKEDGTKNQEDFINEARDSLIVQIEKRHSELTTELSNLRKQLEELQTENT